MAYAQILFAAGLVVITLCTFLVVRIILDMRQRIVITVHRPTTSDGESVQITANLRASADAQEVASHIEKASLAIQGRIVKQNEHITKGDLEAGHQIWLRIRAKLDDAEKEGRTGMGTLSKPERKWWASHRMDYDKDGPKIKSGNGSGHLEAVEQEPVSAEG